jgi:hypothetical protein
MGWLRNPKKKIQDILIKIGKGRVSEADMASLIELLGKQPSAIPEVIGVLAGILKRENTDAYNAAITALSIIAEKEPELVAGSLDAIMSCIRRGEKEFPEDWILDSLDILIKISQKCPERMGVAVPDLIMCLENISTAIREKSYFLLALLAIVKPEVFRGHSKELVRVLNGLNIDERIYACRLIKKIAERDPKIVEDTHDVLEDLHLNHIDSNLRSEAAYAVEELKVKEKNIKQKPSRGAVKLASSREDNTSGLIKADKISSKRRKRVKAGYLTKDKSGASDIPFSELANLIVPNEKDVKDILKGLGLNHLIMKK